MSSGRVDPVDPAGMWTASRSLRYGVDYVVTTLKVISGSAAYHIQSHNRIVSIIPQWSAKMLPCEQAAAALAASVTTEQRLWCHVPVWLCQQHALRSSVHAVVDLWHELSSRTARHYSSLMVTDWQYKAYKPTFEQWRMAADDEYAVMPVDMVVAGLISGCRTSIAGQLSYRASVFPR